MSENLETTIEQNLKLAVEQKNGNAVLALLSIQEGFHLPIDFNIRLDFITSEEKMAIQNFRTKNPRLIVKILRGDELDSSFLKTEEIDLRAYYLAIDHRH
jgi:hypothetical protein